MANVSMLCHPATPAYLADSIDVHYDYQSDGRLWLRYFLECDLASLVVPGYVEGGGRADGLWQSTCFELFVRHPGDHAYLEFNFSPSSQWSAYRFSSYREAICNWSIPAPEIHLDMSDTSFAMEVTLALPESVDAALDVGMSAVVHETGDIKSYWALAHPRGKPDFHHADCFALHIPAPAQP